MDDLERTVRERQIQALNEEIREIQRQWECVNDEQRLMLKRRLNQKFDELREAKEKLEAIPENEASRKIIQGRTKIRITKGLKNTENKPQTSTKKDLVDRQNEKTNFQKIDWQDIFISEQDNDKILSKIVKSIHYFFKDH